MTVAIEGVFPLRAEAPATPVAPEVAPAPSRAQARAEAKAEKLAVKKSADDIPARIRPDRAVFVKPVLFGLLAVAAIGGGISLWSFIDTVQHFVVGGIAGLLVGAGLWTITELAVIMVTLLIAMLNARGEKLLVVIFGWAFIFVTSLVPVFMNFIHAVVIIRPGQDATAMVADIDAAIRPLLVSLLHVGQWVLVAALSAVPLIVLAIIAFIEVALVRRPEGSRKQRLRAVAKREAAADAVAEPLAAAPAVAAVAAPRSTSTTRKPNSRADIQARMVTLYAEGMNDSQIKKVLMDEFGVGRTIFEAHRDAAKTEAGVA